MVALRLDFLILPAGARPANETDDPEIQIRADFSALYLRPEIAVCPADEAEGGVMPGVAADPLDWIWNPNPALIVAVHR
nr:hypothetical protein [Methylobacter marinus]